MNGLAEKSFTLGTLKQVCRQNPFWLWLCLFLWVVAQLFFWVYPPRGYVADDIVLFGSIRGQALVSVQHLWEGVVNDDKLMLEVLEKSGICKNKQRLAALEFLNENVRKNLRFNPINEVLFRISFIQAGKNEIRPFLNTFVERFLHEASTLNDDELMRRRQRVTFQFEQLRRRNLLVHNLLKPVSLLADLTPGDQGFAGELKPAVEGSIGGKLALLLINELNKELFAARVHLLNHTDTSQKILSLFPFSPLRLTDAETPARPVQPYLLIFYLFIPMALFLFFIAGLIYLAPNESGELISPDAE